LTYYTATIKSVSISTGHSAVDESVDNSSGKLVGFEVENVAEAINAPITTFVDTIYLPSGAIDATLKKTNMGHYAGKVTGGTGSYSGAAGTIGTGPDGAKTKVTITLTKK
jgi:hypothetical protein